MPADAPASARLPPRDPNYYAQAVDLVCDELEKLKPEKLDERRMKMVAILRHAALAFNTHAPADPARLSDAHEKEDEVTCVDEQGSRLTPRKALGLLRSGIPWLVAQGDRSCTCGACYLCAYRALHAEVGGGNQHERGLREDQGAPRTQEAPHATDALTSEALTLAALRARVQQVAQYAQHKADCDWHVHQDSRAAASGITWAGELPCTCGLADTLAAITKSTNDEEKA